MFLRPRDGLRPGRPHHDAHEARVDLPRELGVAVLAKDLLGDEVVAAEALSKAEGAAYVQQLRDEYTQDIDSYKLAAEQVVDDVVPSRKRRGHRAARLKSYAAKHQQGREKKRSAGVVTQTIGIHALANPNVRHCY